MHEQSKNFDKEIEIFFKVLNRNHEAEEHNCTEKFTSGVQNGLDQAEEKTSELEHWSLENIQSEEQKEERMKKSEETWRNF